MKKVIFALVIGSFLYTGCKKDDDNNNGGTGNAALLTNGRWKITAISSQIQYPSPVGTQTVDGMQFFQSCVIDNLFIFNTDNTVTSDEGATKCNASDPQQKPAGNWSLTNNNTVFTVADASNSISADVVTLNSTTLTIRYSRNDNGIPVTNTTTYTKQ